MQSTSKNGHATIACAHAVMHVHTRRGLLVSAVPPAMLCQPA